MTQEEKMQFVNENISLVPVVMKSRFEKLDIDKKYERMQKYVAVQKIREQTSSLTKLATKVKDMFDKKGTVQDAYSVIDFCNQFIKSCKEKELANINEEIQRLTELKHQLESEK